MRIGSYTISRIEIVGAIYYSCYAGIEVPRRLRQNEYTVQS